MSAVARKAGVHVLSLELMHETMPRTTKTSKLLTSVTGAFLLRRLVHALEGSRLFEARLNEGVSSLTDSLTPPSRQLNWSYRFLLMLTSFRRSSIWTVVGQSTQASVIDTPYLRPEGPSGGTSCRPALRAP